MERRKQYESMYAGYIYREPVAHWSSTEKVKSHLTKVNFSQQKDIHEGGMPVISNGKTTYVDAADGHTVIIAASGMKKSICCFMPLIASLGMAGENMILTDPKGELFNRTAGYLESRGYKVLCLDFRTMDRDCFNILHYPASVYRGGDKNRGLSLLSDLINALAEDQRHHAKDPFWTDTGALWLNGTGALMLDAYPEIDQINILNWSDFNVLNSAAIVAEQLLSSMPDNTAKAALRQCSSSAENTFRSILITASSFLMMFNQNPSLAAMLSHSTFTLEDLIQPKTALYLVTDDTTSTADPILGIIISQIQSYLIDRAFHAENGKLDTRMNFVLDEFASIPIPDADKALATHRSRNIRYYLCVQSLALMKKRYDDPDALLSNCSSTLYLGSTELSLLSELETKLGKTNVTVDGSEKPLCSVAELMTLEKKWDYKEAIYLNLSEGIRYCTKLPSIETYDLGVHPAPNYSAEPPKILTYTVEQFATDVLSEKVRAPFAPINRRKESSREKRNKRTHTGNISANEIFDTDFEEELRIRFDQLLEPLDEDD